MIAVSLAHLFRGDHPTLVINQSPPVRPLHSTLMHFPVIYYAGRYNYSPLNPNPKPSTSIVSTQK